MQSDEGQAKQREVSTISAPRCYGHDAFKIQHSGHEAEMRAIKSDALMVERKISGEHNGFVSIRRGK